jgi:hypothetical protein
MRDGSQTSGAGGRLLPSLRSFADAQTKVDHQNIREIAFMTVSPDSTSDTVTLE